MEKLFKNILKYYELKGVKIHNKPNSISRVSVTSNKIYINHNLKPKSKIDLRKIVAHEIETHLIRGYNGSKQKYTIFKSGADDYLPTEEGLAIYNQRRFIDETDISFYSLYLLYIATDIGLKGKFTNITSFLMDNGKSLARSFRTATRIKMGLKNTRNKGGNTKNTIYLDGYLKILDFIDSGGNTNDLYVGKIGIDDLETIKNISGIKKPSILPNFNLEIDDFMRG